MIFPPAERLIAVNGVIDLRGREFDNTSTFALNGLWEFYPGQLLSQQDMQASKHTASYIHVPGNWEQPISEGSNLSFGSGTYRLRILFDPLEQPVAFWLRGIQASSAVQINGIAENSFGKPAADKQQYKPRNTSYTASYSRLGATEIELIIQVANYDDPYNGGIIQSIRFGSQAAIDFTRWYSIGFQMVTFITLLLHGLYAFIFYLFNPRERTLALVCLLTMAAATATIAGYDNILLIWLPINYTWALKVRLLAQLWQPLLILLVFRGLTPIKLNIVWLKICTRLLGIYTAFILVAPAVFINGSVELGVFGILYLFPFLWFIYVITTMILKGKNNNGRVFLLLSATGIISNILWAIWNSYNDTSLVYYPLDMIAAIIGFAAYWFREFFLQSAENAKLNEKLRKEDKLKDQFLANTSHELRTPLHGIMNIAHTILTKEQQKLDPTSLKNMNLLITISRRMSHMLDDLLDVARLHEHRIILQKEPLKIQAIVPGIFEMLRYMVDDRPVRLDMNIAESLPAIIADEKRLVQILYNLLHNAIKYTEEGSISISAAVKDDRVHIHVSDTGVGMDQETQSRIFLPYEQGAHGISDGRGIGLGLSICQQLIELHGGTLSVQSKVGKGSVFSFDVPLADSSDILISHNSPYHLDMTNRIKEDYAELVIPDTSAGEWTATGMSPALLEGETVHILAVDDDPLNLNVLIGILSIEPYCITKTHSAQEALELLGTRQWDLVIADVMMPHMSGYELTQRIRANYSLSELPVLLLTARSQPADIYTGFLSGANDYMTKPVDAMELRYRVEALTTLKRSIKERLRMEAAYLQAQIHPHFLFNTLNSIMALSEVDSEKMLRLGDAFASFLRISFDFLNTGELVPLSHELQLVEAYLYIEKERFGDRLSIVWEVEQNIQLRLPPLSVQPLVENAVRHGLLSRLQGGTVRIRIVQQEMSTLIEVDDNGKGMDQEMISQLLDSALQGRSGIGIANTNRRLIQLYGKGLSISSKPGEGTTVSFVIPNHRNR
ncbi:ATP-binding protein [Paenibacillus motobuensis]|uniref:histidine kinase n=1 Tax=Paenibacillus motobuensis TaxID=295324 RepID=A0ABN0YLW0_9BACL